MTSREPQENKILVVTGDDRSDTASKKNIWSWKEDHEVAAANTHEDSEEQESSSVVVDIHRNGLVWDYFQYIF